VGFKIVSVSKKKKREREREREITTIIYWIAGSMKL
jgi:hypothetical protein